MKKRIISIVLSIVMLVSLLPTTALAEGASYTVYVAGQAMTAGEDGTVSYYVNGAEDAAGTVSTDAPDVWNAKLSYDTAEQTLVLEADGLVAPSTTVDGWTDGYGNCYGAIYSPDAPLKIVLKNNPSTIGSSGSNSGSGHGIYSAMALTIDIEVSGNNVTAPGKNTSNSGSWGIRGRGNIVINSSDPSYTLEASASGGSCGYTYGIFSNGSITFNGGTVRATGGSGSSGNDVGISANGITVNSGATVYGTGGSNGLRSYGFELGGFKTMEVNDGAAVYATGGTGGSSSAGIDLSGNLVINGGIFEAKGQSSTGGSYGVTRTSTASFTINGGQVTLSASGGATNNRACDGVTPTLPTAAYGWKTSASDDLTLSTTTGYTYDAAHTYLYVETLHAHPVCGEVCTHDTDPSTDDVQPEHAAVTWEAWDSTTSLPTTAGNYYLTANVEIASTWTPADGTFLCLNGCKITMTGSVDVIEAENFTLTDCRTTQGEITHLSGATGSGVKVISNGTFNMYGGNITGNNNSPETNAGGVYVRSGTFNMYGGSITNNKATSGFNGGGVYIYFSNTFNMYGGTISGNTASSGGGVYVRNINATFNMYGGDIIDNEATFGGGVYMHDTTSVFTMTDGSISSNTAANNGGGVYVNNNSFTVSGSPVITGNTVSGKANNVYLPSGITITVNGALTGGNNSIGVNMAEPGVFAQPDNENVTKLADYVNFFTSDDANFKPAEDGNALRLESAVVSVTGVTLDKNSITLGVGGTETLTAAVKPDDATNKAVTWGSDNEAVATVDNGVVTAVSEGTATITVTTEDGGFTDTCTVTVNKIAITGTIVVTTVTEPKVGETYTPNVNVSNELTTGHYSMSASSFSPSASSDPIKAGTAYTLSVTFQPYSGYFFDENIQATFNGEPIDITRIDINGTIYLQLEYTYSFPGSVPNSVDILQYENPVTTVPIVLPGIEQADVVLPFTAKVLDQYGQEMTGQTIEWSITGTNTTGISVNNGTLTVTKNAVVGNYTLTATCDGESDSITIKVEKAESVAASVAITGTQSITIPETGSTTVEGYTVKILDQYGDEIENAVYDYGIYLGENSGGASEDVTYDPNTGAVTVKSSAAAGEYTFKVTYTYVDENDEDVDVVGRLPITLVALEAQTITCANVTGIYGQTEELKLNPSGKQTAGAYRFAIKSGASTDVVEVAADGKLTIKNAGETTIVVTAPSDATHASASVEVKVTIAPMGVDEPTAVGTYTYTGSEQTVTLDGVLGCMTVRGNKATHAGDYEVSIALDGNHKWNAESDGKIAWSIGAKTVTPTAALEYASIIYSGSERKPTVTLKDGDTEIPSGEYTVSYSNNVNVGTATVTITDKEYGNYTFAEITKTFEITKDGVSPVLSMADYVYGGTPTVPSVSGNNVSGTVTVYYSTDSSRVDKLWEDISGTTLNVGTYYMKAHVAATDNYAEGTSPIITFKVTPSQYAAPSAPSANEFTVTVNEADRSKKLEYSMDSTKWSNVPTLIDGAFELKGLAESTQYTVYLRVKASADGNYQASDAVSTVWTTPARYSVAYHANLGTGTVPASVTQNSGRSVTVARGSGLKRTGYTFAGWNTAANGTGTDYAPGSTISTGATLYAKWTANSYTVKFKANGGSGTMADQSFTYDATQALTRNAFTRDGYHFAGWALSSGNTAIYMDGQTVKNLSDKGTVTLHAVWAENVYRIVADFFSKSNQEISAKLMRGDAQIGITQSVAMSGTADSYTGHFNFTDVPRGVYNIVAEQDGKVMTKLIIITDHDDTVEITMPASKVNSVLEVSEDALPVVVGGLEDEAATKAEESKTVTITMTVEKQEEQQLPDNASEAEKATQEAIAEIKEEASGKAFEFMDIEVEKTVEEGQSNVSEKLTETNKVMEIVIPFDLTGKLDIAVYRHHNGQTEKLAESTTKADGTFYIDAVNHLIHVFSQKFSTYAIGYTAPVVNPPSSGGDYAPTYAITVEDAENGDVKANRSYASSGTTVTITVTPEDGYVLKELSVVDSQNNKIEVTDKGDGTYTFKMPRRKVTVTASFVADGSFSACPKDNTCPIWPFTDAETTAWYHDGVHYCIENGLMAGYGDGIFKPNADTTRAMITVMLWRLNGSPVVNYLLDFEDVEEGKWYTEAIRWAKSEGIATGYGNGYFGTNDAVTREQMVTILWRYAQHKGYDVSVGENTNILSYDDAFDVAEYAIPAMQWACGSGMVQGMNDPDGEGMILAPASKGTRAQIATMIMRFCEEVLK